MRTTTAMMLALVLAVSVANLGRADSLGKILAPISEETPPAVCDPGEFIKAIRCTGSYCDNLQIYCTSLPFGANLGEARWMPWVSEEHGGIRECPARSFLAGLACRGSYCDNLSLYCVQVTNFNARDCVYTRFVSEERDGRYLDFFARSSRALAGTWLEGAFLAQAMHCKGRYCDNKSFKVCEVTPQ